MPPPPVAIYSCQPLHCPGFSHTSLAGPLPICPSWALCHHRPPSWSTPSATSDRLLPLPFSAFPHSSHTEQPHHCPSRLRSLLHCWPCLTASHSFLERQPPPGPPDHTPPSSSSFSLNPHSRHFFPISTDLLFGKVTSNPPSPMPAGHPSSITPSSYSLTCHSRAPSSQISHPLCSTRLRPAAVIASQSQLIGRCCSQSSSGPNNIF